MAQFCQSKMTIEQLADVIFSENFAVAGHLPVSSAQQMSKLTPKLLGLASCVSRLCSCPADSVCVCV